jgi:ABC-type sugar transport system ATPase subunit
MVSNSAEIVLGVENISKSFPGVQALDSVSFDVRRGEVHALVGENGAGKSTLMHILGGALRPDSGHILLNDRQVQFANPHQAHLSGIRVVYQELTVVPNLSVAENIFANSQPVNALGLVRRRELNRQAAEMIALFGEDIDPDAPAAELSIGKRQVLEILKALTFSPRVVLLDEPTSSLSGPETETLFATIRRLKKQGISFIFISHHLPEVFDVADRVTVLRDGVVQDTFAIGDISEDGLIRSMVGRSIDDIFGGRTRYTGNHRAVLDVRGLTRHGEFEDVSITVNAGEIVGISGLVGAGRTELARAVFGASKPDSGTVSVSGTPVKPGSVKRAIGRGIAYMTEDRKEHGLCLSLSIRANLVSPTLSRFATGAGLLDDGRIERFTRGMIDRFGIVSSSSAQSVFNLSGGNQQKVLLGSWVGTDPAVLVVDEPTRGVDVGAKQEIYRHIYSLAEKGTAVVLISSDLNEILGMSDRVLVMRHGRLVAELSADDATEEAIISHALGAGEAVR